MNLCIHADDQLVQKNDHLRSRAGLLVLYDFTEGEGTVVNDRSGIGEALNLIIENPEAVRWGKGSLEITSPTRIRAKHKPSKVSKGMPWTGEVTIEAWIQPANVEQKGPARIVTFSKNGSDRNFTLGQDGNHYDIRFRTSTTTKNGIPSLPSSAGSLKTTLSHVVYTRNRTGQVRVYIDGKLSKSNQVPGTLATWNDSYRLALANEMGDQRPWLGTFHLVALYNRALVPREVKQHFKAGATATGAPLSAPTPAVKSAQLFEKKVAPILVENCLECHNSFKRKGKLDLSTKTSAFAGEWLDQVIVPGDASDSLLLEMIESDEMPKKRTPLKDQDKAAVREWIETGAVWTQEVLDPTLYTHTGSDAPYLRRLTVDEYITTVRASLGVDIEQEARKILPQDVRADGFSNTAYNLIVDLHHVDAYAQMAEIIVDKLDILAFAAPYSTKQELGEKPLLKLVENMGEWVLRGPLESTEVTTYRGISKAVISSGGDYEETVRYILEAMVQSPRFIYRIEQQRGDSQTWPVGAYELASRLSYTIWGAAPDAELIRAAQAGELHNTKKLTAQVDRMLLDPRTVTHSKRFAYEWLDLGRLDSLRPNPKQYPKWKPALATDMKNESLLFFEEVVWNQHRPLSELFNAQLTYLTPALAAHYGLEAPSPETPRVDLSTVPARGGLLTQGSLLTVGGDDASMVSRGLFVLHDILRGTINPPPPNLDTTPVPPSPGQSHRAIAENRLSNTACGGCHAAFEPLAFALEHFDGLGSYHQTDPYGNVLREDGTILFPGAAQAKHYTTIAELMDILAQSERVRETFTWKVTQFSLGRQLGIEDVHSLNAIHTTSQKNGGTYASLLKAIALSDLIQTTKTEAPYETAQN